MEINHIISIAHHCLHLCNTANIEETVFFYAMDADVFVTKDILLWEKKFKEHQINCRIKNPSLVKPKEKILVDGASLGGDFGKWEKKWEQQPQVVCVYNIDRLNPSIIKELVNAHDKMILSVDKIRMLSDKNIEKEIEALSPEAAEDMVKKELKNIVLSLLLSKPMCGKAIIQILYEKFKVFVSPGVLYPALHELEKKGLLNYEYELKNKIYKVKEKKDAQNLLNARIKTNSLLSQILIINGEKQNE